MKLGAVTCLWSLSLWGQRHERLSVPGSMHVDITCFWRPLHPIPPKLLALCPALQSKGGWRNHAQHRCSVMEPSPQCTSLSGRRRGNNQARGHRTDILPSVRTPSPGAPLALWWGKRVSRDEGKPGLERHSSFLSHFTLWLTGLHSVLTLAWS